VKTFLPMVQSKYQTTRSRTPPYGHPISRATSLLWPLYSGLNKSSVSHFLIWKNPFNTATPLIQPDFLQPSDDQISRIPLSWLYSNLEAEVFNLIKNSSSQKYIYLRIFRTLLWSNWKDVVNWLANVVWRVNHLLAPTCQGVALDEWWMLSWLELYEKGVSIGISFVITQ